MACVNSCSWSGWNSPSTAWRSNCLANCTASWGNSFWMERRKKLTSNCWAGYEQRPNWSSQRRRLDLIQFCIMNCRRFLSHPKSMQATVILGGCWRGLRKILQVVLEKLTFPPRPMNPWFARFRSSNHPPSRVRVNPTLNIVMSKTKSVSDYGGRSLHFPVFLSFMENRSALKYIGPPPSTCTILNCTTM